MTKLTPSQLAILASACTRDDGIAIRPRDLKPAAAVKAGAKLIELALVREVRAKGDMPAWGETEQGHAYSLKILKAGRTAVLAVTPPSATASTAGEAAGTEQIGSSATDSSNASETASKGPTKRTLILGLMGRDGGATLDQLIAATGWLPHTTRAALTGLRKSGFAVERSRGEEGSPSVYRIAPVPAVEAA